MATFLERSRSFVVRAPRVALGLVGLGIAVRLVLALGTDLYADETYYWSWSRRLSWGYFDHSPGVAWLMAFFPPRLVALGCGLGTVWGVWSVAQALYRDEQRAWWAAALWSTLPAGVISGVIATPDSPLMLFWILSLLAVVRGHYDSAGIAAGAALLSKYVGVLLGPIVWGAHLWNGRLPPRLWRGAFWAGLLFAPVVAWNSQHGWIGFVFQLRHGLSASDSGGWQSLGLYAGGQLLMAGPLLLLLALAWTIRGLVEMRLLRLATLVPLAFFAYSAWRHRGEANWPIAAYLSACVGLAAAMGPWLRMAIGVNAVGIALGAVHIVFPMVQFQNDVVLKRLHGWEALAGLSQEHVAVVYTPSYQLASNVEYHAALPATVEEGRISQYALWPRPQLKAGDDALWVSEDRGPPDALRARFTRITGPQERQGRYLGRTFHTFKIWKLGGARPGG